MELNDIIHIRNKNVPVYAIVELKDKRIGLGAYDGCIRVYYVDFAKKVYNVDIECEAHDERVNAMCVMNETKMISVSADMTIKVWEIAKTFLILITTLFKHSDYVYNVIPLSHKRFASCSRDKTIVIWETSSAFNEIATLHEQFNVYSILQLTYKEDALISGGDAKYICIWDINGYQKEMIIECCGAKSLNGLIELNKRLIAVNGGNSSSIDVIDVDKWIVVYRIKEEKFIVDDGCYSCVCLLNEDMFVYVHGECCCGVGVKDMKVEFKRKVRGEFCGRGVVVVCEGKYVLIGDCYDGVTVFEITKKKELI